MSEDRIAEILADYANAQEAAAVNLKRQIVELVNATEKRATAIPEQTFDLLKFEAHKSEKLKDFEVADKRNNLEQNWTHVSNILKAADATINSRYHGLGYVFSYWLYQDRVFRQKLGQK
jgi:hypothetical protein